MVFLIVVISHWFDCILLDCGRLLAPVNGAVNGAASSTSNTFGSTVTFTCNTGFQLAGASGRTCESNGQWSERANPICENIRKHFL